jgi:hypothetical protein
MTRDFAAGNYRFIPAVFQYSSGACALPGFQIERVRFDHLMPLAEGFAHAAKYIQGVGQKLTSFCACELRSPAAFTEAGFLAFNQHYVKTLADWGIFDGTTNPVARSNVCPEIDPRPSRRSMRSPSSVRSRGNVAPPRPTLSSPVARRRAVAKAPIPSGSCAIATSVSKD